MAYDWELLKNSLPPIYQRADQICLSLDKYRKSWSGNPFEFDEQAFHKFIATIDLDRKISILEDDFSSSLRDARGNCNYQRTMMAQAMGEGGWIIQVDADEYFIDFDGFADYLLRLNKKPHLHEKPINVCCVFVPLFKKLNDGYLAINYEKRSPECIPMATNRPDYQRARQNGHFNHLTNFVVIHDTWSRKEDEISFKINNWGHSSEELKQKDMRQSYLDLWKALDENNFHYVFNIHPAVPSTWPSLKLLPGKNISELMETISGLDQPFTQWQLWRKNSRNISRLLSLWHKINQ